MGLEAKSLTSLKRALYLVLDHLVAQELGQPLGRADRGRLLGAVLLQRLAHGPLLGDQVEQLVVGHVLRFGEEHVEPVVGDLGHRRVALVQSVALKLSCSFRGI